MNNEQNKTWELEKQVFQLRTLVEIAHALNQCRKPEELYAQILATMAGTFGARNAIALSCADDRWQVVSLHGLPDEKRVHLNKRLASEFEKATARHQHEILSSITGNRPAQDLSYSLFEYLRSRDKTVGALYFGKKILAEPYSREDENLLNAVCSYAASALENIDLVKELDAAKERLAAENFMLRQKVRIGVQNKNIIGSSPEIQKIMENIKSFGRSDAAVLINGETGTGKELVARGIHYSGFRANAPFVAINCTAIPENLVESEFFGIEAGTATGVNKRIGYFEQANSGTLFIDEVGDMPLSSQAKLLRTLQEQTLRRVGGNQEFKIDVRVIAATNKNLKSEIKAGRFREDLYYRLSVLELKVPPLRKRHKDIALLTHHFLEKLQKKLKKTGFHFTPEAMRALEVYAWPGNVRELENEVERIVTLAEGDTIKPEHLSPHLFEEAPPDFTNDSGEPQTMKEAIDQLETHLIKKTLKIASGNKSEVARRLGISRLGLQRMMERLHITYESEVNDTAL